MLLLFFFFQAEDGIRVIGVTGVQTCALPISTVARLRYLDLSDNRFTGAEGGLALARSRSEERRVGKECRSCWSPYHYKEKKQASGGHRTAATISVAPSQYLTQS